MKKIYMTPLTQIQAVVVTSVIANSIIDVTGNAGIDQGGDGPGTSETGDEADAKQRGGWDRGGLW